MFLFVVLAVFCQLLNSAGNSSELPKKKYVLYSLQLMILSTMLFIETKYSVIYLPLFLWSTTPRDIAIIENSGNVGPVIFEWFVGRFFS